MVADLTPDQRRLADFMSDLSEEAYCAGWMDGLEYALWEVVVGARADYGRLAVTEEHRTKLKTLAEGCGGWIVFDDATEQTWVSHADWNARFAAWKRTPSKKDGG
jgi:hypothetical protein